MIQAILTLGFGIQNSQYDMKWLVDSATPGDIIHTQELTRIPQCNPIYSKQNTT
ncbi:hypothetical protein SCFA_620006 [anaerobic digester metagenome]|uniref:Uncharacterized protein n=1 Tax=anaerobic digester metagenome TaxID=1263854 RepID=A0A485M7L0_9ZZZZ